MVISKIICQNRRDFRAIYQCEYCGFKKEDSGYDDYNFHHNVIPDMECPLCHKKTNKEEYKELAPKYPDGFQI